MVTLLTNDHDCSPRFEQREWLEGSGWIDELKGREAQVRLGMVLASPFHRTFTLYMCMRICVHWCMCIQCVVCTLECEWYVHECCMMCVRCVIKTSCNVF